MRWIFIVLFAIPQMTLAQKYDYTWICGHQSFSANLKFGGTNISFEQDTVTKYRIEHQMNLATGFNVSMSDSNGNLLFYSNGCYVSNYENEVIENGDAINPGYVHSQKCGNESYGYTSGWQSGIALPMPDTSGIYFMFHKRIIYLSVAPYVLTDQLLYSIVDMNQNGGKGKVIAKNIIAVADSAMGYGGMTAVRHANGRDW